MRRMSAGDKPPIVAGIPSSGLRTSRGFIAVANFVQSHLASRIHILPHSRINPSNPTI